MVCVIVNYGNDSTKSIEHVLRGLGVKYFTLSPTDVPTQGFTHVILSGGPDHVNCNLDRQCPAWLTVDFGKPVLGICYGMQVMTKLHGGRVVTCDKVYGSFVYDRKLRWFNHSDRCSVPPMFTGKKAPNGVVAEIRGGMWWGVQYHPERPEYVDTSVFSTFLGKN